MKRFVYSLCFLVALGIGHAEQAVQEENVIAAIDPATEVRLGKLWRDDAIKEYTLSTNKEYIALVERIGRRIANAIYERPDLADDWEFTVIDANVVNAFANGGGKVVVFEGLIDRLVVNGKVDEDMLASIIGHEMAHNVRRHVLLGWANRGSTQWVLDNVDKIKTGGLTKEEMDKLRELARARFTRVQEFEADLLGALYATRAGFDGFGGARRWLEMEANNPKEEYSMDEYIPQEREQKDGTKKIVAFDHPTWKERLAKLLAYKESISNLAGEFNWGYYLLQTYDFEQAVDCFKDVTKIFPNSFEAWNNLGLAYHWQYLQTAAETEKFQPGLVDYFVQLRERVRGESPLYKAIRAYQRALQINPHATGTKSNLAVALVETREAENLDSAEFLLQQLLTDEPDDPIYINDLAILNYWKTQEKGTSENGGKTKSPETLFAKAAASDYLPAQYNLAVLQLEMGKEKDGVAALRQYLKKDPFSPWAKLAVNLLKQRNQTVDLPSSPIPAIAANPLKVAVGSRPEDVTKAVGQPDRIEKITTGDGDEGIIYHYDNTLGMRVVFSGGKVVVIDLIAPLPSNQETAFIPSVVGVSIGVNVDLLKEKLGPPVQVQVDPSSGQKMYSYLAGDSIITFTVSQLRTIQGISVKRRV